MGTKSIKLYDSDIREPLFEFLEEKYGRVRILEEKIIGKSRADVVMITESAIFGIEIKSDADTYTRLKTQIKDYDQYYDMNFIVVGASHEKQVENHVPDYWGIITIKMIEGELAINVTREPLASPKMDWSKKITILWRPELAHIQEINSMPAYKQKSKQFVSEKILEKVPAEILEKQVSDELFERDYNTIREKINAYRVENGKKPRRRRRKRYKVKI